MDITPLGDSALLVRVRREFEDDPGRALREVTAARTAIASAAIKGVTALVPGYTTVGVFYDPIAAARAGSEPESAFDWVKKKILNVLEMEIPSAASGPADRTIEIPVCYDPEFGHDLAGLAQTKNLTTSELVAMHSGGTYRVHCIGFTPGFPFMSGLPPALATPRRPVPRTEIAAGSVAIGGAQTGIYPRKSPGGWHVVGRTPLRLFDVTANPPSLLATGDRVTFQQISRDEFEKLRK